jgi:glycosyltransferase involved in cell wall biosynthesis
MGKETTALEGEETILAVVCIPTFRRPDWLERTLASVLSQKTNFAFAVVVVDNDAAAAHGAARAGAVFAQSDVRNLVLVEPNQGNCHAINRAFGDAQVAYPTAQYFLMIDDDEEAMPGWLAAIVGTAERENADIVGGPVNRRFEVPVEKAISEHPLFFSMEGVTRPVDQIHGSGNCLIRRRVFEKMGQRPFSVQFNFLGGGDMEFFTRCRLAGFSTWWCEEAVALEYVPAERATAAFLMRRSLRTGSINYVIDRTRMPAFQAVAKNFVSLGLGLVRSLAAFGRTRAWLPASHPLLISVGRVMASLGMLPTPYKAKR